MIVKAKSCRYEDVLKAVKKAGVGDTIKLPEGTGKWSKAINTDKNLFIEGTVINGVNVTAIRTKGIVSGAFLGFVGVFNFIFISV